MRAIVLDTEGHHRHAGLQDQQAGDHRQRALATGTAGLIAAVMAVVTAH